MLKRILFKAMVVLSLCAAGGLQAATYVTIAGMPAPREVVVVPHGYSRCMVVPAGVYNGIWVDEHRVCRNHHGHEQNIWVSGHWQCVAYRPMRGVCTRWVWEPSHWRSAREVMVY